MHLTDLLPMSWMVRRRWRELGLPMSLSGFQLGCGLLPDLTQGSEHVRANVPLVLEQHRCCVLHRGELAHVGVLQVPGSAATSSGHARIFQDGRE
jgi:hypothetical protein